MNLVNLNVIFHINENKDLSHFTDLTMQIVRAGLGLLWFHPVLCLDWCLVAK